MKQSTQPLSPTSTLCLLATVAASFVVASWLGCQRSPKHQTVTDVIHAAQSDVTQRSLEVRAQDLKAQNTPAAISAVERRAVSRTVTDPRVPARRIRAPRLPRSVSERLGPEVAAARPAPVRRGDRLDAVAASPVVATTPSVGLLPPPPSSAEPVVSREGLAVLASASATAVTRRIPVGAGQAFGRERVFVWVKVRNRGEPSTIQMVWKHEGVEKGVVELNVGKSPRWRTWSRRQMRTRDTGRWSVEVRSADGSILDTVDFEVDGNRETGVQSAQR